MGDLPERYCNLNAAPWSRENGREAPRHASHSLAVGWLSQFLRSGASRSGRSAGERHFARFTSKALVALNLRSFVLGEHGFGVAGRDRGLLPFACGPRPSRGVLRWASRGARILLLPRSRRLRRPAATRGSGRRPDATGQRGLFGSTVNHVVRSATCPVLVARQNPTREPGAPIPLVTWQKS